VVEQQVRIGQAWRSAMLNRISRQSPHYAASFPPTTRVFWFYSEFNTDWYHTHRGRGGFALSYSFLLSGVEGKYSEMLRRVGC